MSVISISRDTNNNVSLVRMQVSDSSATVASTDYILDNQEAINDLNGGVWQWFITDMLLVACSDTNALFQFTDNTFETLIRYGEQGSGMINPGLINQLAYYPANGSTLSGLATAANGVLITNSSGVPSISSTLPSAVQGNITSLGTITSGIWHGTPVVVAYGGTGDSTFTAYSLIAAGTTATGAFQNVSGVGTSGQILTSNGAGSLPTWQANAASGTVDVGTINAIAYYPAATAEIHPITTANNGVLITSGLGVPSISSTLPSAVQGNITSVGTITSGTWNGSVISGTYGGTGINNGASTITIGGNLAFSGAFTFTGTITGNTGVTFPTSGTLATTSQLPTPAALTESNDTNVTMTLGGTPATALLQAVSMTLGWTGQLSLARGGTNANLTASNGGIFYSTATAGAILSGTATANLPLLSGSSTAPVWGSFALSLGGALTTAGAHTLSGAFASTFTFTNTTSVTFPTSGTLATTGQLPTPAALTSGNDTNVTLTLGGTPSTALLQAASITAGWTGTLSLARGGTAAALTASNGGIFYSTASAGAILAGTATAGLALLSGASTVPTWSTSPPFTQSVVQVFTSTGTYTPTTGMKYAMIEVVGGGGGGGGTTGGAGASSAGSGGGGGGYARKLATAAQVGASGTVTVNSGGTAGTSGGGTGGTGGTCSIALAGTGTITISSTGGAGGAGDTSNNTTRPCAGGSGGGGGVGSGGDFNVNGAPGITGIGFGAAALGLSGNGGSSALGGGGPGFTSGAAGSAGNTGGNYGGGGSGSTSSSTTAAGGAGAKGIIIVTELISV